MGFLRNRRHLCKNLGVYVSAEINEKIKISAIVDGITVAELLRKIIDKEMEDVSVSEKVIEFKDKLINEFKEGEKERILKGISTQEAVKNASFYIRKKLSNKVDRKHVDLIVNSFVNELSGKNVPKKK